MGFQVSRVTNVTPLQWSDLDHMNTALFSFEFDIAGMYTRIQAQMGKSMSPR